MAARQRDSEILHLHELDPQLEMECGMTETCGKLTACLVARRLRSCAWLRRCPVCFAGLLNDETAAELLNRTHQAWENYQTIADKPGAFWKKIRARSQWSWKKVEHNVKLADFKKWQPSKSVKNVLHADLSGVIPTKLFEEFAGSAWYRQVLVVARYERTPRLAHLDQSQNPEDQTPLRDSELEERAASTQ